MSIILLDILKKSGNSHKERIRFGITIIKYFNNVYPNRNKEHFAWITCKNIQTSSQYCILSQTPPSGESQLTRDIFQDGRCQLHLASVLSQNIHQMH